MGSQNCQDQLSRKDSNRKRVKKLSERRRVFSRIGLAGGGGASGGSIANESSTGTSDRLSWSQQQQASYSSMDQSRQSGGGSRSDSPSLLADNNKISMKIQFHIIVAPENEPLILDTSHLNHLLTSSAASREATRSSRQKSVESIGDHIHERLTRQNTLSTRRRQQLLAMHNQTAKAAGGDSPGVLANNEALRQSMPERLASGQAGRPADSSEQQLAGREQGVRSSTITGGMSDEETMRFLAKHQSRQQLQQSLATPSPLTASSLSTLPFNNNNQQQQQQLNHRQQQIREHIYFKRDGQRFGHEFTLKLSVERTYRCLLKVRPLIPLQGISIQGHQILFVDCSQLSSDDQSFGSQARSSSVSAPASSFSINKSWQNINANQSAAHQQRHPSQRFSHHNHHRLSHHQTIAATPDHHSLYQQQQSQMIKHFSSSHCSSTNSHLGKQLIYMFDWSAQRFEVNKNKNRTQVQTNLKFKNGQILTLPLQVKFYEPDSKQHLSWGSQLHFIDYDCSIDSIGSIKVDRIQYY